MITEQKQKVIKLLAREWQHSGPPGIMDIGDIVAGLNQAPSETLQAIKSLHQTGLVDMNSRKTSVFLTPEGYAAAEDL